MSSKEVVSLIRKLLRELRFHTPKNEPLRQSAMYQYIMEQTRKYQVTDEKICNAQDEMKFRAQTYLCYLSSQRRYKELHQQYHGKGERGVEETAALVGLKLPQQYKHDEHQK